MTDNFQGGAKAGATSVSIPVVARKTTDNTEKTGLVYNTAGNIASYQRQGAARVAITLATQTVTGAYSSGGFVEVDATNQPGLYRLDVPDAAFAAGVDWVVITFVSTGQYVYHEKFQITSNTIQTGDNFARIGANGAGLTGITGAQLAADQAVNATKIGGTAQTGRDLGASVLLSAGTGAGQLDFTAGIVKSNATQILGTTVATPATAGVLDVNVKNWGNTVVALVGGLPSVAATTIANAAIAAATFAANALDAVWSTVTRTITGGTIGTYTGNTPQTGDSYPVVAHASYGNAQLVRSATPANAIAVDASGRVDVGKWLGTAVLLVSGLPSVAANLVSILGTALTETAGLLAAGFKKFFNVATPTGTVNSLPNAVAGAQNGLLISGANTGPMSISGGVTFSNGGGDAFTCSSSASSGHGLFAVGNGTGSGLYVASGGNGHGLTAIGGSNGNGLLAIGQGTGHGIHGKSGTGATGQGIRAESVATNDHGFAAIGKGTGDGFNATGGASAGGDGIAAVAGGGVDVRGNITGNLTGNVSGSTGSVAGDLAGKVLGGGASAITGTGVQAQIPAGGIATNAIDANAIKADAVTKIQSGLATAAGVAGAASSAATAATKATLAVDHLEADESIDTTTTPDQYQQVKKIKATATEILRKKLYKSDGVTKVDEDTDIVGQRSEA